MEGKNTEEGKNWDKGTGGRKGGEGGREGGKKGGGGEGGGRVTGREVGMKDEGAIWRSCGGGIG